MSEPTAALWSDAGIRSAVHVYSGELYGFACRSLDDRALAQDAVQEVFLRAWRAADRFDPRLGSMRSWLFAILRNVVIDFSRARELRRTVDGELDGAVEDDVDVMLRSWLVEEALRRLTADHRRAIVEVYFYGRSAADLGAELGVPDATVRTRLFYGLKALRLALDELGWDDG